MSPSPPLPGRERRSGRGRLCNLLGALLPASGAVPPPIPWGSSQEREWKHDIVHFKRAWFGYAYLDRRLYATICGIRDFVKRLNKEQDDLIDLKMVN